METDPDSSFALLRQSGKNPWKLAVGFRKLPLPFPPDRGHPLAGPGRWESLDFRRFVCGYCVS